MAWSTKDDMEQLYCDVLAVWGPWANDLRGAASDSGHHMAEEAPDELAEAFAGFLIHRDPDDASKTAYLDQYGEPRPENHCAIGSEQQVEHGPQTGGLPSLPAVGWARASGMRQRRCSVQIRVGGFVGPAPVRLWSAHAGTAAGANDQPGVRHLPPER